ncbi:MAG: hypothetical protein K0Q79_321 [Flavipsychrobacter sp.]|jgi:hypothetical protein|nr:hypothetical protein [Flavipsychrobacter sp.]
METRIDILKKLLEEVNFPGNRGTSDGETSDGKEDIDSETLQEQIDLKKAQTERYKSNTKDRVWLAEWAASVVSIWLALVFIILISNSSKLHLSDTVLNVLLGTTTLNVLGLIFIVLRGHFGNKE